MTRPKSEVVAGPIPKHIQVLLPKVCARCNEEKDANCFNRRTDRNDQLESRCKDCLREVRAEAGYNVNRQDVTVRISKKHREQVDELAAQYGLTPRAIVEAAITAGNKQWNKKNSLYPTSPQQETK